MRAAPLLAAILLSVPLVGCLSKDDLQERWDDLEVRDRYEERTLLLEKRTFSIEGAFDPMNLPSSPEELGDRWTGYFTVPNGTRSLSVTYSVQFQNATPPEVPVDLPKGSIAISIISPGNESEDQEVALSDSGGAGFDYRRPSPGEWELRYNARGRGEVAFNATAVVPINATSTGDGTAVGTRWT